SPRGFSCSAAELLDDADRAHKLLELQRQCISRILRRGRVAHCLAVSGVLDLDFDWRNVDVGRRAIFDRNILMPVCQLGLGSSWFFDRQGFVFIWVLLFFVRFEDGWFPVVSGGHGSLLIKGMREAEG